MAPRIHSEDTFAVLPDEPSAQELRFYSAQEILSHSKPEDCWLIIHGKVYDVTSWIPHHPGGTLIYVNAGRDCTQLFDSYHPLYVRKLLERYCIGVVKQGAVDQASELVSINYEDAGREDFYLTLKKRVENHFRTSKVNPRVHPHMFLKSLVILATYLLSYYFTFYWGGSFVLSMIAAIAMGTVESLWDVLPLFSNTGWGENSNIAFLEKHMGTKLVKRTGPLIANFSTDDIHSGDFLALSKIRGRWGGFETLEKWVTGAYAGHTAVCIRDEDNQLWVGESGHENEKGEEIIAVLPWNEWWQLQLDDVAHAHVALLPLHPDVRARFNATAAWQYTRQMEGKPYGYHNMIFSWIDTAIDNYPPPLDAHVVMSLMTMWTRVQPAYAANMWNEALNKRLGTEGLDLPSILQATEEKGVSFDKLLAMPEDDEWIYSDGKSTSCVAFVLAMYKAAGLFGPTSDAIQVTEFTIRDAYMLKFFEDNRSQLPAWCNAGGSDPLPYCQLLGEYLMELPGYNSVEPYAHMNENCPSLAPDYLRPDLC